MSTLGAVLAALPVVTAAYLLVGHRRSSRRAMPTVHATVLHVNLMFSLFQCNVACTLGIPGCAVVALQPVGAAARCFSGRALPAFC